jgi:hypothetical protein
MRLQRLKRYRPFVVVALLALLAAAVFLLQLNEPSYKGHSFDYWLDRLPATIVMTNGSYSQIISISYSTRQEAQADEDHLKQVLTEANAAVDELGTNRLRALATRLSCSDSRARLVLTGWAVRFHFLKPFVRFSTADFRRGQAVTALMRLGNRAKPILPELFALTKGADPSIRAAARQAAQSIAPQEYRQLEREGHSKTP